MDDIETRLRSLEARTKAIASKIESGEMKITPSVEILIRSLEQAVEQMNNVWTKEINNDDQRDSSS